MKWLFTLWILWYVYYPCYCINEWALIEIFDINSSANIAIWKQAFPSMIKGQSRTWWNSLFSVEKQINQKTIDRVDYCSANKMRQWIELMLYATKQKLSTDRNMQELTWKWELRCFTL